MSTVLVSATTRPHRAGYSSGNVILTSDGNAFSLIPLTSSLWPAGINSSAPGTVQWSGGMINWDDPDYKNAGHFYALVKSISVTCNDPSPASANVTSYVYGTNSSAMTPSIAFSQLTTVNGALGAKAPAGTWATLLVASAAAIFGALVL